MLGLLKSEELTQQANFLRDLAFKTAREEKHSGLWYYCS
jgi:hypothetical protein